MRNSESFIIMYAINDRKSFATVETYIQQIEQVKQLPMSHLPCVLVGNKADLESKRQVPTIEGQKLADKWNSRLVETSAKDRTNIDEVFEYIVRQIRGVGQPTEKTKTKSKNVLSKKNILKQLKCKTL